MRGIPGDQPPLRSVEALLHHHPLEEEGKEWQTGAAYANGVRQHPTLEQSGRRVSVNAAINVQQGVALAVVLPQERHCCRPTRVH